MSDRFDHTVEHTLESKPDDDDAVTSVRRIELITLGLADADGGRTTTRPA
jgi:hypothetical protein